MKILLAVNKNCANPLVKELSEKLIQNGLDVTVSDDEFWRCEKKYDIVHIHWPEALSNWKDYSFAENYFFRKVVLPHWQKKSKVVCTVHNESPHTIKSKSTIEIYEEIHSKACGLIHMGRFSQDSIAMEYDRRNLEDIVIPHHVYNSFGIKIDRNNARERLVLSKNKKIVLCFGALRHLEEKDFLLSAFKDLDGSFFLLAPSFGLVPRPGKRNFFKWLKWEVQNRERLFPKLRLTSSTVSDDEVNVYFSAADVVVIPRLKTLNSGNIPLAFKYGCPVVSSEYGNIGEITKETGNFTFDPDNPKSLSKAINDSYNSRMKLSQSNLDYGVQNWSLDKIALAHKSFYELLSSK